LAVVTKGYPVIFDIVAGAHGVGVAFNTEVAGTDLIAVDTEGIWNLSVVSSDDAGNSLVVAGDPLYINTTTAVISKIRNNATQIPFGYALCQGNGDGAAHTLAVKVHWDPRSHWLEDLEMLYFGDARDVNVKWEPGIPALEMLPLVTDTGAFHIGDGTLLLDQLWFGTAIGQYLQFDASADELINVGVAIRIAEDEVLEFGAPDHTITYTGEEIVISGDRTTGGDGDYYRVWWVQMSAALGAADRWAAIGCYNTLTGGAGGATWAAGGSFSLQQAADKQVDGYIQAIQGEMKNAADACSTAAVLCLIWDNDSNVGFGGLQHSFIRFDDNCGGLSPQCLFDCDNFVVGAADNVIFSTQNAWAVTHTLKISVDGVAYWIGLSNAR